MRKRIRQVTLGLVLAALALACLALSPQERGGAAEIGTSSCADCHDDMVAKMAATIHGKLGEHEMNKERMCEACHGPGSIHGDSEGETPIPHRFKGDAVEADVDAACVSCHLGGDTLGWPGSMHAASGVNCLDCHNVKEPYRRREPIEQAKLCAACHSDQRALFDLPSHHPLREGKMACSDCHNPHGSEEKQLRADSVNDLCFRCHADKEGPFLHEHEPVRENCLTCHFAKGAPTNNLLRANEAILCLRCHAGHEDVHPRLNSPTLRAGYMTKCTRCHSQIHGSDLPGFTGPSRFVR
jgi:DmsE family decaheme c-type cytochrome